MEHIELKYCFKDGDNEAKEIRVVKKAESGLHDYDVCEMFVDFMSSIGFSEDNVYRFFNE